MSTDVRQIENAVSALPQPQLVEFRAWFAEFDALAWDRQLESNVEAGRLDQLAQQALDDHKAGKTTSRGGGR